MRTRLTLAHAYLILMLTLWGLAMSKLISSQPVVPIASAIPPKVLSAALPQTCVTLNAEEQALLANMLQHNSTDIDAQWPGWKEKLFGPEAYTRKPHTTDGM